MTQIDRRKFLFTGVTTGIASSLLAHSVQAQSTQNTPDEILATEETLDAIFGSEASPSVRAGANSAPTPAIPYDRTLSRLLIRCSRLGMEQFERGQSNPRFDGSIRELPGYSSELDGYTQVTSFRVVLDATTTLLPDLSRVGRQVARRAIEPTPALIGFVLTSDSNHIILFRGTSNPKEWMANFQAGQSTYRQAGRIRGRVHTGFLRLYNQLAGQVRRVVNQLNPALPYFVAGHSLGGALATLATADLTYNYSNLRNQIRLYTYGAPRVGDQAFAEFLGAIAPNSYRVINMADMVTMVPPAEARNQQYHHIGEEWVFLDYAQGSVGLSHSTTAYQAAIDRQIETNIIPGFPTACQDR